MNQEKPLSRRRGFLALTTILATAAAAVIALPALALQIGPTGVFELEGNALTDNTATTKPDDWDRVCYEVAIASGLNATQAAAKCTATQPTNGATAVAWAAQGPSTGFTFTGGGSKDPLNIEGWAWNQAAGGLPGKDILLNGFAARYTSTGDPTSCPGSDPTATPPIPCNEVFFGMDRFDNAGDAQNGFWFLQSQLSTTGGTKSGGGTSFTCSATPCHVNGDVLVVSDFSNGGTNSTITVYGWNSACTKTGQSVTTFPAGTCADTNLVALSPTVPNARCDLIGTTAPFCGIVNPNDGTTSPWTFLDKTGHIAFQNGEFYEGGIDLSFFAGIANECFASSLAESRSSTSTSAVLKSFVLMNFGKCTATMSTTPSTTGSVTPGGTAVKDTATVVGSRTTLTPSGTVSFSLCQFPVGDTTSVCDGTINTGTPIGTGTLSGSGGTASADSPNVNCAAPSPGCSTATGVNPLAPGSYCFFASWPGDANYTKPLTADGSNECFTVAKIPTTTHSSPQPSNSVNFGDSVTDHAVVQANTTGDGTPTGTVTFFVCTPSQVIANGGTCSTGGTQVGSPVNTTDANPPTTPPSTYADSSAITANVTGTWCFRAVYTPGGTNGNNYTGSSDATSAECFLVSDTTSGSSTQTWFPEDSAMVSSAHGAPLTGNLSLQLYTGDNCGATSGAAVTGQLYQTPGNGTLSSLSVSSNNQTSYSVSGPISSVSWLVTFTSTDTNVGNFSHCEKSTVTVTN